MHVPVVGINMVFKTIYLIKKRLVILIKKIAASEQRIFGSEPLVFQLETPLLPFSPISSSSPISLVQMIQWFTSPIPHTPSTKGYILSSLVSNTNLVLMVSVDCGSFLFHRTSYNIRFLAFTLVYFTKLILYCRSKLNFELIK